jgi:hypothetical protein
MWSHYNYTDFPVVYVSISGPLRHDDEFKDFINSWKKLYNQKRNFNFVFYTKDCGYVHIKYAFSMVSFIKKLKTQPKQYLKSSIILYHSKWIKYLLQFIFSCQSPVAPVYLLNGKKADFRMIKNIHAGIIPEEATIYLPNKTYSTVV